MSPFDRSPDAGGGSAPGTGLGFLRFAIAAALLAAGCQPRAARTADGKPAAGYVECRFAGEEMNFKSKIYAIRGVGQHYALEDSVLLDLTVADSATAVPDSGSGRFTVLLHLAPEGADRIAALKKMVPGREVGFTVGGVLMVVSDAGDLSVHGVPVEERVPQVVAWNAVQKINDAVSALRDAARR